MGLLSIREVGLIVVWCIAGLATYGVLLARLFAGRAKALASPFGPPDAALAGFIAALFGMMACEGFESAQQTVTNKVIINGALHETLIVLVMIAFLVFRNIRVAGLFGFRCAGLLKMAALAVVLLLAAFPLLIGVSILTQHLLGPMAQEQELVQFFSEAVTRKDFRPVISIMAFGIFLAPAAEEFIFRGYLYGVAKKYFGLIPAMILTSLLFAAIHVNLSSLPGLFVLAVCLTIAYETTGSLLVAMAMHALFNFSEFTMMLAQSQ